MHSRRRLQERYDLNITWDEYNQICDEVSRDFNKYCFKVMEDKTKKVCWFMFKGKKIYFLYDTYFGGIRTMLPSNAKSTLLNKYKIY